VRLHNPDSAGFIAWWQGFDASEFARIYYMGLKKQDRPPDWSAFQLSKAIIVDLFNIVATVLTLYQACTLPETSLEQQFFTISLWAYPNRPVAIVGFCLLFGQWTFPRSKAGSWWLIAFTTLVLVGIGAAIAVCLWKFANTTPDGRTSNFWFMSTIFYECMAIPMILVGTQALFSAVTLAWMARIGGVGFAALYHNGDGQPYCKIKGPAFAIVYMTLGGIAALNAIFGLGYHASGPASNALTCGILSNGIINNFNSKQHGRNNRRDGLGARQTKLFIIWSASGQEESNEVVTAVTGQWSRDGQDVWENIDREPSNDQM
jgi:hypothetical protein